MLHAGRYVLRYTDCTSCFLLGFGCCFTTGCACCCTTGCILGPLLYAGRLYEPLHRALHATLQRALQAATGAEAGVAVGTGSSVPEEPASASATCDEIWRQLQEDYAGSLPFYLQSLDRFPPLPKPPLLLARSDALAPPPFSLSL